MNLLATEGRSLRGSTSGHSCFRHEVHSRDTAVLVIVEIEREEIRRRKEFDGSDVGHPVVVDALFVPS